MARQALTVPQNWHATEEESRIWDREGAPGNPIAIAINRDLRPDAAPARLAAFEVGLLGSGQNTTYNLFMYLQRRARGTDSRQDLSDAWELNGRVEVTLGSSTWLFSIAGADRNEEYEWEPSNEADTIAFYNAAATAQPLGLVLDDGQIPTVRVEGRDLFWGGFDSGAQVRFIEVEGVNYGDWAALGSTAAQKDGTSRGLTVGRRYQFRDGDDGHVFPETGHVIAANTTALLESAALVSEGPPDIDTDPVVEVGTEVTFLAPDLEGYATDDGIPDRQWQQSTDGTTWTDISGAVFASYRRTENAGTAVQIRVIQEQGGFTVTSDAVTVTWRPALSAATISISGIPVGDIPEQEVATLGILSAGGNYDEVTYEWAIRSPTQNLVGGLSATSGERVIYEAADLQPRDYIGVFVDVTPTYRGTGTNAVAGSTLVGPTFTAPRFQVYGVRTDTYTRWAVAATEPDAPSATTRDASSPWTHTTDPGAQVGMNVYRLEGVRTYHGNGSASVFESAVWSVTQVHSALLPVATAGTPTLTPGTNIDSMTTVQFGASHAGGLWDEVDLSGWSVSSTGALGSGTITADGRYTAPTITDPNVTHEVALSAQALYRGTGTNARAGTSARAFINATLTIQGQAITDTQVRAYAVGFVPPAVPASTVETPGAPWQADIPDPTETEHVWRLTWDRVYSGSTFVRASGVLTIETERTEGEVQVINWPAGTYDQNNLVKRWEHVSGSRPAIERQLLGTTGLLIWLMELRQDANRLALGFTTVQDGATGGRLSDAWYATGWATIAAGDRVYAVGISQDGVAESDNEFTLTGARVAAFQAFRNALPNTDDAIAAQLILDDGTGLLVGRRALLGDGTVAGQALSTLLLGDGTVAGVAMDTLLLGDGATGGIEVD